MSSSSDKESILVVDDSASTLEIIQRNLMSQGYKVFVARGVSEALEILGESDLDLVITDLKMPKVSGFDLVRHVRENFKDTEVMVITGYPSIEGAVKAVKIGAEEFLPKPFTDEELVRSVGRVLDKLRKHRCEQTLQNGTIPSFKGIIGSSRAMREVYVSIEKAISTSASVLITGESGTGKELVARAIHYGGPRSSAPFVPVNCGGIPEDLLESEMFGHVKGAFTGAVVSRAGFFHTADGGTIFLDEIGEMSFVMQVKLLRVLQDKEVRMVGSDKSQKVDVRILAATNKNLEHLVNKGRFREDLFYRLNVIPIAIPPLRERENDIVLLANHFVKKYAEKSGRSPICFSDEALQRLRNYNWPGNVRELENVVQRLVVMSDGELIEVSDLPELMHFSALRKTGFKKSLSEVEAEYIRNVLASVGGNKTRAAKILGIDRKTLREKIRIIEGGS